MSLLNVLTLFHHLVSSLPVIWIERNSTADKLVKDNYSDQLFKSKDYLIHNLDAATYYSIT